MALKFLYYLRSDTVIESPPSQPPQHRSFAPQRDSSPPASPPPPDQSRGRALRAEEVHPQARFKSSADERQLMLDAAISEGEPVNSETPSGLKLNYVKEKLDSASTFSKKRCGTKPVSLVVMKDIDVHFPGVLGATGAVGTRFVLLLAQHPLLELVAVGASKNSADKRYSDVVHWKQSSPIPAQVANLIVRRCVPTEYLDCDIIFSGLNSDVAGDIEMDFLQANFAVFSNAKNFRLAPLVPLIVPVVNLGHIESIPSQRRHYQLDKGFLVCNSNCAVIGLVIPAAALIQKFGPIDQVSMVTMQAVSGAGYPGVSSK